MLIWVSTIDFHLKNDYYNKPMKEVCSRNGGTSMKKQRKKKNYNNMKQMRVRSILLVECF